MNSNRLVFASACFGILIFGISLVTLGSVAPSLQQEFALDKIASGALFSILPVGILIGSILFGPFADRFGYKIILILSGLIIFAGFQGIAYSGSLNILRMCVFLFGISGGALNGAANALVSDISDRNKSANLSLLGVFFAIGALGMPFVLGTLQTSFSFKQIVSAIGTLPLAATLLFIITRFPEPKQKHGLPLGQVPLLLRNEFILLVGFFLFCQSSFEGIINNWTTTYLIQKLSIEESKALYALSLYVLGMAVMRIFIGGVFRRASQDLIVKISFLLLLVGCLVLWLSNAHMIAVAGLIAIGAGLAAGFPVMLGFIGNKFAELSGTAFSIVLTIALLGNMIVNFLMGVIAEKFGIQHLPTMAFGLTVIMITLFAILRKKSNL
ncbi:MAG TPA: MFS transporter [Chryseolinea sp.]|nr:MFS transporter [Chryseolinea sp.]